MTDVDVRAAVDVILKRDGLRLAPEERERLIGLYDEFQTQLAALRDAQFAAAEPAVIFHAG